MKPSHPKMTPAPKPEDRKLFLMKEQWEELADAASFEDGIFKEAEAGSVSRNDFIEFLLKWALPYYWEGKGGKPKTAAERLEAIRRLGAQMKAEQKAKAEAEKTKK